MNFAPVTKVRIIVALSCILIVSGSLMFFKERQNGFEESKILKNHLVSEIKPTVVAPNNSNLIRFKPSKKSEVFYYKLAYAASSLTDRNVVYDPKYFQIKYPGGDLPFNRGVCTDLIIRAYRKLGIDLQVEVHNDISKHFELYPKKFGSSHPDTNIDHRRVPNLMVFFKRKGMVLPVTKNFEDYKPGDIVTCIFPGGLTHIAIVSAYKIKGSKRFLIVHNGGYGQVLEDALPRWKITGHYRYSGK